MLASKSLTELRSIAQSFDIPDIFSKDQLQLAQAIEMKQQNMLPPPVVEVSKPEYDARLLTKPPAKKTDEQLLREYGAPYESRGIKITYDDECWYAVFGKRNDQGTLRMPPKVFIRCLDRLLEPAKG